MKTIFCDTQEIAKTLKSLEAYRLNDWRGFNAPSIFADIQKQIRPELDYLNSMYDAEAGTRDYLRWNCLPAFYDLPDDLQRRAQWRGEKYITSTKGDILNVRSEYLYNLHFEAFTLFHSWQFQTQGWTAY